VDLSNGEAFLMDVHISPYAYGNRQNHPEKRPRKLLLKKSEIRKLKTAVEEKGLKVVPLKVYFKGSRVKAEIAVARGKKLHDKRESQKNRQADRDIQRVMKGRR